MKAFAWVKLNQQAELRFNKALLQQTIFDFTDLLDMLNAETRMNGGNYTRANSEDVLIAVRGQGIERASASVKQVVFSCLGEHSAKPRKSAGALSCYTATCHESSYSAVAMRRAGIIGESMPSKQPDADAGRIQKTFSAVQPESF